MQVVKFFGIILFVVLFGACGSGGDDPVNPEVPDKPVVPEVSVPTGEENFFVQDLVFERYGGERSLVFKSNVDWSISVSSARGGDNWCTVRPASGKAGVCTVKIMAEKNTSFDERSSVLTLSAKSLQKKIKVVQKQKDAIVLSADRFEVGAKGDRIKVEVQANISFDVSIPKIYSSWISQSTKSRGLTSSTLVFDIAESEETVEREGEIVFKSGDLSERVRVYQAGQKILRVSKKNYDVSAKGEKMKVVVKSNVEYEVVVENEWISKVASRGLTEDEFTFSVLPNKTSSARTGKIIVRSKDKSMTETIVVNQAVDKGDGGGTAPDFPWG